MLVKELNSVISAVTPSLYVMPWPYNEPNTTDDSAKGGLTQFWEHFYRDSLRAKIFKTLITSLLEDIWVSN